MSHTHAPEYVLGTDAIEAKRLGLQHRIWSAAAHQLWELAGVRPGMTVMDLGCGPGHATFDLATIVGGASPERAAQGRVIALDESATFLHQLNETAVARRLNNIERVLGDVQSLGAAFPSAAAFADVAYLRWVLCFVPRPMDVVAGLAKVVKPGGKVAIQDYFNYESMTLAPRHADFSRVIAAVARSWRSGGGDPDIVSLLPGMLRQHGFRVDHLAVNQRIARPGSMAWAWPDSFWASFVPRLVDKGFITAQDANAFFAVWSRASHDPDCYMHLPPLYDVVATKL